MYFCVPDVCVDEAQVGVGGLSLLPNSAVSSYWFHTLSLSLSLSGLCLPSSPPPSPPPPFPRQHVATGYITAAAGGAGVRFCVCFCSCPVALEVKDRKTCGSQAHVSALLMLLTLITPAAKYTPLSMCERSQLTFLQSICFSQHGNHVSVRKSLVVDYVFIISRVMHDG